MKLVRRLRYLWNSRQRQSQLGDELEEHIALHIDELMNEGMNRADAELQARRRIGNPVRIKEQSREVWVTRWMDDLVQDLRGGIRLLARNRTYALVAVSTLALGIGSNTAVFTMVNDVLLKPLPYNDSDRLVVVWERNSQAGKDRDPVAPPNFEDWVSGADRFEGLAAYRYESFALTGSGEAEQLTTLASTANLFEVLDVEPLRGRTFTDQELTGNEPVVVLGHRFWQRRFGSDPAVVGRAIELSNRAYIVIGVMEPGFDFPSATANVDVYSPLILDPYERSSRVSHTLSVIGKLRPGVSLAEGGEQLGVIARGIADDEPTSNPEVAVLLAHEQMVENVKLSLLALAGAVGFVLLITCANVANLVMVRSSARSKEIAVRIALGCSRMRIIRQLLTENLVLAILGGASGVLLAAGLIRMAVLFGPQSIPRLETVRLDLSVLGFTLFLSIVTGLLFGLTPAVHSSRSDLSRAIKQGPRRWTESGQLRGRSALVVAELALSLVVLVGAALMLQSFVELQRIDYGFRPGGLLAGQIFLDPSRYPTDGSQYRSFGPDDEPLLSPQASFFEELLDDLETLPGVEVAAAASALPLDNGGIDFDLPVVIEGRPGPRTGEDRQANLRIVTAEYFHAMDIPVARGRSFTEFDGPDSRSVMMINETMAEEFFPGEDPLGQNIVLYGRPREIVGVSGSVRHYGFDQDYAPEIILPSRQFQFGGMTIVLRTSVPADSLVNAVRSRVAVMDPDQPIYRLQTMETKLSASIAGPRFTALLLSLFAALAVAIAVVGTYGVFSYRVAERTQEMGLRMALGANRHDVISMVVREGIRLVGMGLGVGLLGALVLTRLMQGLLFNVSATDPRTFLSVALLLAVTALVSVYIPARRGTQVDPSVALRSE